MTTRQNVNGLSILMLVPRMLAACPGQYLPHLKFPLCLWFLPHLGFPACLHLNLKLVLLSMPCRRLRRQFVTFSTDKRSVFSELRIMCSILLLPWSGWSRFSLTGVHQRWRSGPWSRAWVGVSAVMGPHFWRTMIRSRWLRVRVGEMLRGVRGGSGG